MIKILVATLVWTASFAWGGEIPDSNASAPETGTVAATASPTSMAEPIVLVAKSEADIPVHLEPSKKSTSGDSPWLRMLASLAVVGVLAAGTWIFLKRAKGIDRKSSLAPEIKVLAQHYLGPKRSLLIIRVAGESILLGATDQNINLIKSLSLLDEDIPEKVPSNFATVFSQQNDQEPIAPAATNGDKVDRDFDEFSISGIKDVVTSRLKNMRNLQ